VSTQALNQALLDQLRLAAKIKARQDRSRSHMQWLDVLSAELGFTFNSLTERIKELEAQALAEAVDAEDERWMQRLEQSRVWGALPPTELHTLALPVEGDENVPWPHSLAACALFSLAESGARPAMSGPVYRLDGEVMAYEGDELRIDPDQTLLMAFIMASRGVRCGERVESSLASLEARMGCRLAELGMPIEVRELERTLWRLSNCRLEYNARRFDGPILAYVDATRAPDHFEYAFNPAFANFYYPFLAAFGAIFGEEDESPGGER